MRLRNRIFGALLAGVTCLAMTVQASAAELAVTEEELAAACSSDWGYNDIEIRSNPEGRRQLYNKLLEVYSGLWTDDRDIPYDSYYRKYVVDEIDITGYGLSTNEAFEVYYTFRLDHPLFYFVSSNVSYGSIDFGSHQISYITVLTDEEYAKGEVRKAYREQIKDYIAEKAEGITGLTRKYEIARYFHDMLCKEAEYAYVSMDGYLYVDWRKNAHNIIGIITEGKGVCESYAKVYSVLLNYAGVSNVIINGDTDNDGQSDHTWNAVQMDNNKFYDFDVTWDDQYIIIYDYFARGSAFFDTEHVPDSSGNTGSDFLYDLPEIPEEDYDPKDIAEPIQGDIDGDNVRNMRDLVVLQLILNGYDQGISDEAADVNHDGSVNMKDYIFLQRLINGYTE